MQTHSYSWHIDLAYTAILGYYEQSTIEPAVTGSNQDLPWDLAFAKLSNRTVFVPIAVLESPEEHPWFEGLVSAVSLVFTFITVIVFSCALLCSFYKRLKQYR